MAEDSQEITQLLLAWSQGDQRALEELMPLVQAELHHLASRYMQRECAGHVLQTTALVNEAYLRLIDQRQVQWQNRAHFFGVAANFMRRILVDFARAQQYQKRGGAAHQVLFDEALVISEERDADLVALDDALATLSKIAPRQARVVELRFFGGLSLVETAECLHISPDTVTRDWNTAKAWLYRELNRQTQSSTE